MSADRLERWAALAKRSLHAAYAFVWITGDDAPLPAGALSAPVGARGSLSVADDRPREWTEEERQTLVALADALAAELEVERAATVLASHNRIHEVIAMGAPLPEVLTEVVASMERYDARLLGSIMLLEPDGHTLRAVPAPTLPASYTEPLNGARIGPAVGSCGTAIYHGTEVISHDLETDERWVAFRELTRAHGLRHCWSFPIRSSSGRVFGTFGVYGSQPRSPSDEDTHFLRDAAHLAGIAIEHHRALEALRHRATHDPLTDLPDRAQLDEQLAAALGRARRSGSPVSVLFIDVDRLRLINDSLGHQAGDEVLCQVAERMGEMLRPGDVASRVGGDEFVVVAEGLAHAEAAGLAQRIVCAVGVPLSGGVAEGLTATVSVGVATAEAGDADATELVRRADDAMYAAKADGGNRHRRGTYGAPGTPGRRLQVENALRGALERGEFDLVGQPLIDLGDGSVCGVEALLRWTSPELGGPVAPDEFIPIAEESGMMDALGAWVVREACRLHAGLGTGSRLTVNASPRQLRSPAFAEAVAGALGASGLPAGRLAVEITETALLGDDAATLRTLASLRRMGVGVLLDDFGTGFSSLAMLRDHELEGLKIDRSFVAGLPGDATSEAIVTALVAMASALGRRVIAEGIETAEQLEHVRALGCRVGQGYLLGRPVPFAELRTRLAAVAA